MYNIFYFYFKTVAAALSLVGWLVAFVRHHRFPLAIGIFSLLVPYYQQCPLKSRPTPCR